MLTVYSTQGSPGASTTAMHLAANWATAGREVLLIEADPAGGSLSHNLGIQFTPGSASFVASGLPILSNHLIDHAQDVLFENLHVMPAPASPTGARGIFNTFAEFSEDLRTISENEMAVIIDGGRMTADTAASALTTGATGVVVVCRNNSQLPSLEHLREALAASPGGDGPQAFAVTVGKSPMDPEEWQDKYGLTFSGSIEIVADMSTDLSAYLARSKRKSKKWRASLEQVGENLYPLAQPPVSDRPRRTRPATSPETEPAEDAGRAAGTGAAAVSDPSATQDPAALGEAPPMAPPEDFPVHGQPAPPMAPAAGAGYGQSHYLPPAPEPQPGYGQSHYLPPTGWPGDPRSPGAPPGHGEAPPMAPPEGFPAYGQPAPPPYPPQQYPPHAVPEQPPTYQQPPPEAYPPAPGSYEQPQPGAYPPQQYPAHADEQPQPPAYELANSHGAHEAYPPAPGSYEQPQPGAHEAYAPHQYPAPTYASSHPPTNSPAAATHLRTATAAHLRTAARPTRASGPRGNLRAAAGGTVSAKTEHAAHRLVPGLGRQAARLERRGHDSSPRRVRALSPAALWQTRVPV